MPASLSTADNGKVQFISRAKPAWHGLGTVFEEGLQLTPPEAIVMADCDFEVQKLPMTVRMPNGEVVAADQVAIVRLPTHAEGAHQILGYASRSFEVVQNMELGFMLEPLGKEWQVETVGALGNGEQVFITLDAGSASVAGEEIKQFLLVTNAHDGKRAMRIALTPVRVVCQNTLITGLSSAVMSAAIPHRSDIRNDAQFTLDLISSVRRQQAQMLEEFEKLAVTRVVDLQVKEILEKAYPDPKPWRKQALANVVVNDESLMAMVHDNRTVADKLLGNLKRYGTDYENKLTKVRGLRDLALERYNVLNETAPSIAGTAWAVYQGVTEVESHRGSDSKATSNSILFGERARFMSNAYGACLQLIQD